MIPRLAIDTAAPYATRKLSSPEFDSQMWDGRVPTRYSDSFRFSLDYELEAVGANGAKSIELWGSTDGGKSWERWGSDPDMASPFDIETKDEGVFGFRIVVLGHNGLTTPRPLPGETPDIVIVVDKEKPDVRITGASYGEGDRAGSLVIRYACTDPNLMQRPIALSFSDTPTDRGQRSPPVCKTMATTFGRPIRNCRANSICESTPPIARATSVLMCWTVRLTLRAGTPGQNPRFSNARRSLQPSIDPQRPDPQTGRSANGGASESRVQVVVSSNEPNLGTLEVRLKLTPTSTRSDAAFTRF